MAEKSLAKLREQLEQVKELKSEHYIGSQQAFRVITSVPVIKAFPGKLADALNSLPEMSGKPYNATPERLSGIETVVNTAFYEPFITDVLTPHENRFSNFDDPLSKIMCLDAKHITVFGQSIREEDDNIGPLSVLEPDLGPILDAYSKIFINANNVGVVNDRELRIFLEGYATEIAQTWLSATNVLINESDANVFADFFGKASIKDHVQWDWSTVFSAGAHKEREVKHIDELVSSNIDESEILKRLRGDQVDHRFEYRRQILLLYLRGFTDAGVTSYDYIVSRTGDRLKKAQDRLPRQTLDPIIEAELKLIDLYKFLRHLLGSEKSFVQAFLRS